jgi:hypothetical protein
MSAAIAPLPFVACYSVFRFVGNVVLPNLHWCLEEALRGWGSLRGYCRSLSVFLHTHVIFMLDSKVATHWRTVIREAGPHLRLWQD